MCNFAQINKTGGEIRDRLILIKQLWLNHRRIDRGLWIRIRWFKARWYMEPPWTRMQRINVVYKPHSSEFLSILQFFLSLLHSLSIILKSSQFTWTQETNPETGKFPVVMRWTVRWRHHRKTKLLFC
jgi:hypothetical protein